MSKVDQKDAHILKEIKSAATKTNKLTIQISETPRKSTQLNTGFTFPELTSSRRISRRMSCIMSDNISMSSAGSQFSRASGIKALDDMRTSKAESVDTRQLSYYVRTDQTKQLKQ